MQIELNNITFGYDKLLFDNLYLTIRSNTFITILGKNGCGKTSLIKLIVGDEKCSGEIKYNNLVLDDNTKEEIRKNVSVIYNNYKDMFIYNNVYDDIAFSLEKSGCSISIIDSLIKEVTKDLDVEYLINKKTNELSDSEKQLAILICMIINEPKVLILDNILNNIEYKKKKKVISYLKKKDMTVINITDNVEDIFLSDEIVIINDKKCKVFKDKNKLFRQTDIFNNCNLKLPFMVDLSNRLEYYNLLDKIITDKNELVDEIWK